MFSLGIDSGSTTTKGILLDDQGIKKQLLIRTSASPRKSLYEIYHTFHSDLVTVTVTTGYGRSLLKEANRKITEITCHAKGSRYFASTCVGVIDVGGQDSKVIALDEDGNVSDFLMNDKCAAGTGRFMEVMMGILETELEELDQFVMNASAIPISSMCTVFAESEIISLLANDISKGNIALGVVHAIAERTANFYGRLNLSGPVFFSGGLSRSKIFCHILEEYLGQPLITDVMGQFAGAIGAALIGYESVE